MKSGQLPGSPWMLGGSQEPPGNRLERGAKPLKGCACSGAVPGRAAAGAPPAPPHEPYLFIYPGCHSYGPMALTSAASHPRPGPGLAAGISQARTDPAMAPDRPLRAAGSPSEPGPLLGPGALGGQGKGSAPPSTGLRVPVHPSTGMRVPALTRAGMGGPSSPQHRDEGSQLSPGMAQPPPALSWVQEQRQIIPSWLLHTCPCWGQQCPMPGPVPSQALLLSSFS